MPPGRAADAAEGSRPGPSRPSLRPRFVNTTIRRDNASSSGSANIQPAQQLHRNPIGPAQPSSVRTADVAQASDPAPAPAITTKFARAAFGAMAEVASVKLQDARAAKQTTAAARQAAETALAAVPEPTAAELAARTGPAREARDAAVHVAAVAWEAIVRPRRSPQIAQGPMEATFRPPAGDVQNYTDRWNRASIPFNAAVRAADQAQQDALNPPRAAAVRTRDAAIAADTAAAAAVDAARNEFIQIQRLASEAR